MAETFTESITFKKTVDFILYIQVEYIGQFWAADYHRRRDGSEKEVEHIRNCPEALFSHELDDLGYPAGRVTRR